jgi:serine protease AprX
MEPGSNQNSQVTQPLLERTVAERLEHLRESGTYGADRYLEAMQNITSEAIVPTGLDLKYRAGEEVRLTPGFHAEPGTRFHAFIHPCDAPGNSFHPKAMQAGAPEAEIENESVYVGMELYPNPANGSFTVRANFISENGIATIRVFGPTGNLALSSVMRGPQQFIDSSGLHGLYMVVVECAGVQQTRKIILQ